MRRQARILKPTKTNTLPQNWIALDVIYSHEMRPGSEHTLRLHPVKVHYRRWRIRNGKECCVAEGVAPTGENFWTWLSQFCCPGTNTWIISCSAYTDWTSFGIWRKILDGEVVIDEQDRSCPETDKVGGNRTWQGYVQLEDPPTVIVARLPARNSTITIVDIRNYCCTWHPSYDVSKSPYTFEGDDTLRKPGWEDARAKRRVAKLCEFVGNLTSWLAANDLGTLKPTFSSQAYSCWRHSHLEVPVWLHNSDVALKLERAAYIGGRCECRFIGRLEGKIYQLDFNSLYPSCAAGFPQPVRLIGVMKTPSLSDMQEALMQVAVIATVDVATDFPCLPLKHHDAILYPTGQFTTTLCGPELMLAGLHARILRVREMALYDFGTPLHNFYKFWLHQRLAWKNLANDDMASFMKLAANGLIGKLGQRNKRWVRMQDEASDEPFAAWWQPKPGTSELTTWRSFARNVSYLADDGEGSSSIPQIASYVTSYARSLLWTAMVHAGLHNVYYYDTDSIWTNDAGLSELWHYSMIDDVAPGKLKIVDCYSAVEWKGIKHYIADGKLTCAGRPKDGILSHDWRCVTWEGRKVMSDLWAKNQPFAELVLRKWQSVKPYGHGKVQPNGWVIPWQIMEIQP